MIDSLIRRREKKTYLHIILGIMNEVTLNNKDDIGRREMIEKNEYYNVINTREYFVSEPYWLTPIATIMRPFYTRSITENKDG